jgi:uncharacterized protein
MKTNAWVFDTNTLMSALLFRNSVPRLALEKAMEKGDLVTSVEVADEYFDVFSRSKFDKYVSLETRLAFLSEIMVNSILVETKIRIMACRDPKDNKILELAVAAEASAIITGDKDLLVLHPFQDIPILSVADFLSQF